MLVPLAQAGERFWLNWLSRPKWRARSARTAIGPWRRSGSAASGQAVDDLAGTLSGGQQKLLESPGC